MCSHSDSAIKIIIIIFIVLNATTLFLQRKSGKAWNVPGLQPKRLKAYMKIETLSLDLTACSTLYSVLGTVAPAVRDDIANIIISKFFSLPYVIIELHITAI